MLNDITSIDFTETLANYYDTLKKYKPISREEENELMELAKQKGISEKTLRNAKDTLQIKSKRSNNQWYWSLD